MKIPINLASQPFRRDRALIVASAAVGALLVASLVLLIALALTDRQQFAEVRKNINQLNQQIRAAGKAQQELDSVLRKPENAEVLERSVFLNTLLDRKSVSWTRILADLEKVLPHNVRVLVIQPSINARNQITLELLVGAESPDPVINLYMALEGSPLFGGVQPQNYTPPSQTDPLYRYRLRVNYVQKL